MTQSVDPIVLPVESSPMEFLSRQICLSLKRRPRTVPLALKQAIT